MRIGMDSRVLTGPIRLAIATLGSLALLITLIRFTKPSFPILIFFSVSLAYLFRIIVDEFNGKTSTFQGGSSVIVQFTITTLIPSFYLYLRPTPSLNTLKKLWIGIFVVCLLLNYSYRGITISPEGLRASGVMEMLGIINPIVVGHVGAILIELSIYLFLFTRDKYRLLYLLGCSGFSLILISNSRGPLLALLLVTFLIIFARFRQVMKNGLKLGGLLALLACLGILAYYSISQKETVILERIMHEDDGGSGRTFLYMECLKAAIRSPIFGESIFITMPDGTQSGSESFLLDPLLATGLFFGMAWIGLAAYATISAIPLFLRTPQLWIIPLFLHGLVLFGLSAGLISAGWGYATFLGALRIKQLDNSRKRTFIPKF